ncbi:hypothetical protein F5Y18DRAFT_145221 [Xylariaceae sp. FL1019]|nr:hypothetical protein F5Y18DRAFT_145221 [Xylariaceae sp. FL1019]
MDALQLGPSSSSPLSPSNGRPFNAHQLHIQHPTSLQQRDPFAAAPMRKTRKRKAETQDNERLSKRLSLLNLEKNGQKLYVPVETPTPESSAPPSSIAGGAVTDDDMRLDDTKHKVYIYDIDAELSSTDGENSESESSLPGSPTSGKGRLVFLPDIEKHLRRTRIPAAVFANPDGELAGHSLNDMQMVLYRDSEPSSLTVAPENDSVRKAILEARARAREKQKENAVVSSGSEAGIRIDEPKRMVSTSNPVAATTPWRESSMEDEGDAMDID